MQTKVDIDEIRTALAEPLGPLYGSDLVPMIADLCDELEQLRGGSVKSLPASVGSQAPAGWAIEFSLVERICKEAEIQAEYWIGCEGTEAVMLSLARHGFAVASPPRTAQRGEEQ